MSRFRRQFFLRPTKILYFYFLLSSQDEKNAVQYCFRWKDIEEENYAGTRLSPLDFFDHYNLAKAQRSTLPPSQKRGFILGQTTHIRVGGVGRSQTKSLLLWYWMYSETYTQILALHWHFLPSLGPLPLLSCSLLFEVLLGFYFPVLLRKQRGHQNMCLEEFTWQR